MPNAFTILGHARHLPARIVPSADLEDRLGLPRGWAVRHAGVSERHWVTTETNTDLGAAALQTALDRAGMQAADLDLVICASGSFDHPIPFNACLLLNKLAGANPRTASFDIDATCLSFVVALNVATAFLETGRYARIAIVTSEISSLALNPADPKTYCLFGDGAAAFIIGKAGLGPGPTLRVADVRFETHADGANLVGVDGGGAARYPVGKTLTDTDYFLRMEAFELLRFSLPRFTAFFDDLLKQNRLTVSDFDLIVPHQVSRVGLDHFTKTYTIEPACFWTNLARFGNCIAASVPLGLSEALDASRILPGNRVLLVGSAAGLSLGAMVLVSEE